MIPFLFDNINSLFKSLYCKILKDCYVSEAVKDIVNFDLEEKKYRKRYVELGCAATEIISNLKRLDMVDESAVFEFYFQCRALVVGIITKLR